MISFWLGTALIWLSRIKTKVEFFIASRSMTDGVQLGLVRSFELVHSLFIQSFSPLHKVAYAKFSTQITYQAKQIN